MTEQVVENAIEAVEGQVAVDVGSLRPGTLAQDELSAVQQQYARRDGLFAGVAEINPFMTDAANGLVAGQQRAVSSLPRLSYDPARHINLKFPALGTGGPGIGIPSPIPEPGGPDPVDPRTFLGGVLPSTIDPGHDLPPPTNLGGAAPVSARQSELEQRRQILENLVIGLGGSPIVTVNDVILPPLVQLQNDIDGLGQRLSEQVNSLYRSDRPGLEEWIKADRPTQQQIKAMKAIVQQFGTDEMRARLGGADLRALQRDLATILDAVGGQKSGPTRSKLATILTVFGELKAAEKP